MVAMWVGEPLLQPEAVVTQAVSGGFVYALHLPGVGPLVTGHAVTLWLCLAALSLQAEALA